ncbi:MAG: RsmB/NOP family class I SAM-dependent RNA methyltransferase [Sedimentitalea sp.]
MTPSARISAAIDLMERILNGELADRALAGWGRKNRYAGSKDRAAIADLVYDVLRRKRSLAARGGGESGRALLLGYVRDKGLGPDTVFGAGTYAPPALSDEEQASGRAPQPDSSESADFPEWLWRDVEESLGANAQPIAQQMRHRAGVHLRVNLAKLNRDSAIEKLASEGIISRAHVLSPSALEVVEGAKKIKHAQAYLDGEIELQDASSQAVADVVPLKSGETLLDFCAGGGGKSLAVAARVAGRFFAHDIDQGRMKDLPVRAARAGMTVDVLSLAQVLHRAAFDAVLIDAPCSGSGSWRRDPQGKWMLTPDALNQTVTMQRDILEQTAPFVKSGGYLVYATCSLLERENSRQVDQFLSRHNDYSLTSQKRFTPLDGGDGFYCAVLQRG